MQWIATQNIQLLGNGSRALYSVCLSGVTLDKIFERILNNHFSLPIETYFIHWGFEYQVNESINENIVDIYNISLRI